MKPLRLVFVLLISLLFLSIGAAYTFAESISDSSQLRGRDIANAGKIDTIKGTLKKVGNEWALQTIDNQYDIHLGPEAYRENKGFLLTEDSQAIVKGFIINTNIAVTEISVGNQTITLRDESGRPAWAGSRFARGTGRYSRADHDHSETYQKNRLNVPQDLESLDNLQDF